MKTRNVWLWAVPAAIVAVFVPYLLPKFQLRMITEIIILSLFAMTWKMMLNEGGMFSFGHALYFGAGAYASVLGWLHIPGLSMMGGILVGTALTLLFLPALYVGWFGIKEPDKVYIDGTHKQAILT